MTGRSPLPTQANLLVFELCGRWPQSNELYRIAHLAAGAERLMRYSLIKRLLIGVTEADPAQKLEGD